MPAWSAGAPSRAATLFAPDVISSGDDDAHVTFDPDGRHVYFLKDSPDFRQWTIAVVEWNGTAWSEPRVAPFSGRWGDGDLSFAPDGRTAYFVSTRPPTAGGKAKEDTDIWRLRRRDDGEWGEPEHVPELASDGSEWYPNLSSDGWLYFGSEREEGNVGPRGTSDLWRARLVGDRFAPPENLGPTINTAGEDIEAWISPDGRMLLFASNGRRDTLGSYDLYVSHRCGESWTEPRNLGGEVNSPAWEFGARPSPDGRYLFFTSNRILAVRPPDHTLTFEELVRQIRAPGNGLRDIYRIDASVLDLTSACVEGSSAADDTTRETHRTMDLRPADSSASPSFPIIELRQYTLRPGRRDELIDLFEREFVESQEGLGMKVLGTFRDLDRPDRFVWIRGFRDMPSRAEQLDAFYSGPVWRAHREAANATMLDSDNVLLLRAARAGSELPRAERPRPPSGAAEIPRGLVLTTLYSFSAPVGAEFIDFFDHAVEPQLRAAGATVRATYVSETSPNNFPRLPIREGEHVFAWFSTFADPADYERFLVRLDRSTEWRTIGESLRRQLDRPPEFLRLQPTARSELRP